MLKIEDFKDFGTKEFLLAWRRFKKDGQDKEIDLSFCAQPYKDDAWYQIVIGDCLDDDFVETEKLNFNSLKKAIGWWNTYFEGKDEKDSD